jgi:hypothetical protein
MITYCQSHGFDAFDWDHAIKNPPPSKSILHENMCKLSESWVTCACGNLCEKISRDEDGCPNDHQLMVLGITFSDAIHEGNWDKARQVLYLIEIRSTELLL